MSTSDSPEASQNSGAPSAMARVSQLSIWRRRISVNRRDQQRDCQAPQQ